MKTSKTIDIDDIDNTRYISKRRIDEHRSAQEALFNAENRVKNLCEQAQNDYEEELEKAYEEGKNKAKEEWLKNKLTHSRRAIEHLIAVESSITSIIEQAIKKIIGEFEKTETVKKTITTLMSDMQLENTITLRVKSEKAEEIKELFSNSNDQYSHLNIVGDLNITDTQEFILETPSGNIESSTSKQIDKIIDAIKENF